MKHTSPVSFGAILLWGAVASTLVLSAAERTPDSLETPDGPLRIQPINHATLALQWNGKAILVDPVGGLKRFQGLPRPDLVIVTDIHGDHLSKDTLAGLAGPQTKVVGPPAVVEQLPAQLRGQATTLGNGQVQEVLGISIEAIPAYNLTADRLKYHEKGRGNGYVLTLGGKRVYLSGDTEDIPEMVALTNIDLAFVCMNLPYTMTVDQAARAVRAFKPRIVYPYHYRGADLDRFKQLVGADSGIEIRIRDWYSAE